MDANLQERCTCYSISVVLAIAANQIDKFDKSKNILSEIEWYKHYFVTWTFSPFSKSKINFILLSQRIFLVLTDKSHN